MPEVTQSTIEPRLLSSQSFCEHVFVTTNHFHAFPWIRASLYKEPWGLFKDSFVRQMSFKAVRDSEWVEVSPRLVRDSDCLCGLVVRVPAYRSIDPGFDSRRYHIFWEIVGLERGPPSLVSTIEELLGRNSSGSVELTTRHHQLKLALTSPICSGRLVGVVRLRTKTTEFSLVRDPSDRFARQTSFRRSSMCELL
jgi:hypothetical protein